MPLLLSCLSSPNFCYKDKKFKYDHKHNFFINNPPFIFVQELRTWLVLQNFIHYSLECPVKKEGGVAACLWPRLMLYVSCFCPA